MAGWVVKIGTKSKLVHERTRPEITRFKAMRVKKSAPKVDIHHTRPHEMTRPHHSYKAMRVPKKSAPVAAISTLNADLFTDWFKAAKIRALNENYHGLFKDTWGGCTVPTLRDNHGFKLEARWERCPKKRVVEVGVLHGSSGDAPSGESSTPLPSARDDASCASTSLGTPTFAPSRDFFLRETATNDTYFPRGNQGSVFGWLRRSYLKFFISNQGKASEKRVSN